MSPSRRTSPTPTLCVLFHNIFQLSVLIDIYFVLMQQSAAAQAALQAAQALAGQTETQGGPNTVLRVIVEHMVYPVTLDVLFQVQ